MQTIARTVAALIAINGIVAAVAWSSLSNSRNKYEENAAVSTQGLSKFVVGHLDAEYDRADQALQVVADEFDRETAAGKPSAVAMNALIRRQLSLHPSLASLRITDAQGDTIFGYEGLRPPAGSNISERAYFIELRENRNSGLVVSEPVLGKITGKWGIPLARRLNDRQGEFAGIIFSFLEVQAIQSRLVMLSPGGDASIVVRDARAGLIARFPTQVADHSEGVGSTTLTPGLVQALSSNAVAGSYFETPDHADGAPWIYSYLRHAHYPFYVQTGLARDSYLGAWYGEVKATCAIALAFGLTTCLGAGLLLGAWGRRERTENKLRQERSRLREVLWSADVATWEWKVHTGEFACSGRWASLVGYSLEELFPVSLDTWSRLIHPDDKAAVDAKLVRCFARELESYECEVRLQHKDGRWVWVLDRGRVVEWDKDAKPVRMVGTRQDITDRKHSDELQVKAVLEAAPDGMLLVAANGAIRFANRISAKAFGFTVSELLALRMDDLVAKVEHPYSKALRKDGSEFLVSLRRSPFALYGELLAIASITDVSERVAWNKALVENETKLRKAMEIAGFGSYVTNLVTGKWESSPQLDAIFGIDDEYPRDIAHWNTLLDPAFRQAALDHHLEVAAGRCDFRMDYQIIRPVDGVKRWVAANGELEFDADGIPLRLIGTIQDITGRKQIEDERKKSHDLLAKLSEQVPGVFYQFRMDSDGLFSAPFASRGVIEMFGYTPAETVEDVTRIWNNIVAEDREGFTASIRESALKMKNWEHEFRVQIPGQAVCWREGRARPEVRSDGSVVWHGHISDATQRVQVKAELQRANETLESRVEQRTRELNDALAVSELAMRSRGEFLAKMSHEIRTPLNSMLGMAYMALRSDLSEKERSYLKRIEISGAHLLAIVNDILDFSKIDAGKIDLEERNFELGEVLHNIMGLHENAAQNKGLHLALELGHEVPHQLRGDPMRLGQILANYVGNAIKFTQEGQVVLRVQALSQNIDPSAAEHCLLRFEVEDSGIGLTQEQLSRLFQPFEQGDNSTTRKFGGTGLGLVISKELAHLMGGEVGASSRLGLGSTFWLSVRLGYATAASSDFPLLVEATLDLQALRGIRVLVVDDNEFNLEVARELLEDVGVVVSLASDGAQAIACLNEQPFDAVLMDIQMPVMDGLEATRLIRANALTADLCIIALTANVLVDDREGYLVAGMTDVVTKPIEPRNLYATLLKWQRASGAATAPCMDCDEPGNRALTDPSFAIRSEQARVVDALAVWDASQLVRAVGADPVKHRRLLDKFLLGARSQVAALMLAAENGLCTEIADAGHKLKSSARTVGAMRLGGYCEAIEDAGRAGDAVACKQLAQKLEREFVQACTKIGD